jgi:saccharopine dehydrogenase-like NADP-dependent oxidoreductase
MPHVCVLGGTGRIGRSITTDLLAHTQANITISGRHPDTGQQMSTTLGSRVSFLQLDLADEVKLAAAIASADLVIHCAGPFHDRDARVLKHCIDLRVNYIDVSDHRSFTLKAQAYGQQAQAAGVTAVINTGIFPGLSNSMVRQDVEALDHAEHIHLSYVVAGTGGAGITIMRTTFLGLLDCFDGWIEGKWQPVQPYSERETIHFPAPYGKVNVFWFDVPEALTLAQAFPVNTVVTKFGSVPEIYNGLTWAIAHWLPKRWLQQRPVIEFLSWASYTTTQITDRWSGTGVAMRSQVQGQRSGRAAQAVSTLVVEDTAIAAGYGTGSLAQLILAGDLAQPGVWTVETCLPPALLQPVLEDRGVQIQQTVMFL